MRPSLLCLQQERYNDSLCKIRVGIERVNGQWKRRWGCLHGELRVDPPRACKIIIACAVVYNISKDLYGDEGEQQDDDHEPEDGDDDDERGDNNGFAVRDSIVRNFFT